MFSRIIDKFRRQPDFTRTPRGGQVLGEIVAATLNGKLPPDFQRTGDLMWVSNSSDHIRHVLRFQAMKGASYSGCWGVSMDFVPVLTAKGLAWKRTAKTATCDLRINPIDMAGTIPRWCSFSRYDTDRPVQRAALAVLKAAKMDWSRMKSLTQVIESFERRSKMEFLRFSLDNYLQTDLAWGLALIAIGEAGQGQRRLDNFCERTEISRDTPILLKAQNEAAAIAAG